MESEVFRWCQKFRARARDFEVESEVLGGAKCFEVESEVLRWRQRF